MSLVIKIPSDAICIINPKGRNLYYNSQVTRVTQCVIKIPNDAMKHNTNTNVYYSVVFDRLLNLFIQSCPYLRVVYDMAANGELFNFM